MQIVVEYFGVLRERIGKPRETWPVRDDATVGVVLQYIANAYPELASILLVNGEPAPTLLLAVDDQQATPATVLHDGAELLLVPPVSGGQWTN